MIISIGIWSDISPSYYSLLSSIFYFGILVVATMSMFVFFSFSFLLRLVHKSSSCIVHPVLIIYCFHIRYFSSLMSVLISKYTIYGMWYPIFRFIISLFTLFHFSCPYPFYAWMPASIHFVLSLFTTMLVTYLSLLNNSFASLNLNLSFNRIAVPLPLCWY